MNVGKRLQIDAIISALAALGILLVIVLALQSINKAVDAYDLSGRIIRASFERVVFRNDFLRTGSARAKEQWFAKHEEVGRLLKSASEHFRDAEDLKTLDAMFKDHEAVKRVFSNIVENREKGRPDRSPPALAQEVEGKLLSQLNMRIYEVALNGRKLQESGQAALFSTLRLAGGSILLVLVLVSSATFINSWTMSRSITERIDRLHDGAAVIGEGNLDHRIEIKGKDEFAELSDAFNAMTGKLRGSYRDLQREISERKQAEESLRESEQRWAVTLGSVGDAVIATDLNGRVDYLNAVAEELTGWSKSEAAGKRVREVFSIVNEYTRAAVENPVAKVLQSGKIVGLANHTVLLRRGGGEIPIDDSGAPILDEKGQTLGVVLIFRDITARRQAEMSLQKLNETLEQRVAERTRLAETRAVQLQAIAVELIEAEERERKRVAELLHDDLQQILASARMQLRAAPGDRTPESPLTSVEQLLDDCIRKSRRLSHELSPAVLHHSGLVPALQWLARQMADQFGLEVQLEADMDPQFESVPLKVFLFRSVQELLFNIVKHAGVKSARVVLSGADNGLVLTVSDQGNGFNSDILDSGTITETGFGLLTLRERARYIGGSLVIESSPQQGSRLILTVPVTLARADELQREVTDQPAILQQSLPVSASAGSIRVLFVDDHHIMRQGLIKLMVGQPEIHVAGEAANGKEAIERVRELKPNLVMMDISMPEMDGIEATRHIKTQWPDVRVIGLSMHEDEHFARLMHEAGADAFLTKTASPAELLKTIYRIGRH